MRKINWFIILALLLCLGTPAISSQNLIINGNFELGNVGFASEYTYTNVPIGGKLPGEYYAVGSNPYYYHDEAASYGDHTSGTGNMMIVNGNISTPYLTVWEQTVSVSPSTDYEFSLWISNWCPWLGEPAQIEYFINDTLIGTNVINTAAGDWEKYSLQWSSGTYTAATIKIIDTDTAGGGNDFAIDDISFVPEPATLLLLTLGGLALRRRK
jgi:hypothetical protein